MDVLIGLALLPLALVGAYIGACIVCWLVIVVAYTVCCLAMYLLLAPFALVKGVYEWCSNLSSEKVRHAILFVFRWLLILLLTSAVTGIWVSLTGQINEILCVLGTPVIVVVTALILRKILINH